MKWLQDYQLVLLDFDGLLVNTEAIHLAAYERMCAHRGFHLDWNLNAFYEKAHLEASGLKEAIYREFPDLFAQEPNWEILYAEKKKNYKELLKSGLVQLMPGVEKLLRELARLKIKRCVVTNSTKEEIQIIKEMLVPLYSIPYWITREHYSRPKPDAECYLKALSLLAAQKDRVIGFEDSLKGLQALEAAKVKGVLICSPDHPQLKKGSFFHFPSFEVYTGSSSN